MLRRTRQRMRDVCGGVLTPAANLASDRGPPKQISPMSDVSGKQLPSSHLANERRQRQTAYFSNLANERCPLQSAAGSSVPPRSCLPLQHILPMSSFGRASSTSRFARHTCRFKSFQTRSVEALAMSRIRDLRCGPYADSRPVLLAGWRRRLPPVFRELLWGKLVRGVLALFRQLGRSRIASAVLRVPRGSAGREALRQGRVRVAEAIFDYYGYGSLVLWSRPPEPPSRPVPPEPRSRSQPPEQQRSLGSLGSSGSEQIAEVGWSLDELVRIYHACRSSSSSDSDSSISL